MVFWSLPFVLMELLNLLLALWELIWRRRVLLFKRWPLMLTRRMARVSATFKHWRRVARLFLQTLVSLCLSGLMLFLHLSISVTDCLLQLCLLILLHTNLSLARNLTSHICVYGGANALLPFQMNSVLRLASNILRLFLLAMRKLGLAGMFVI